MFPFLSFVLTFLTALKQLSDCIPQGDLVLSEHLAPPLGSIITMGAGHDKGGWHGGVDEEAVEDVD
jgi:hypothetical protein